MKSSAKSASTGQLASALLAIVVIIGATVYTWSFIKKQATIPEESEIRQNAQNVSPPIPTPTPTPRAIPHGKWGFGISTSQPGPKPGRGYLDPYDPAMGGRQTITLYVADNEPVTNVRATIKTDNKVHAPITLTRINGSDLAGEWQGSWIVDDTYLYTYIMIFEAQSKNGKTTVESTFR